MDKKFRLKDLIIVDSKDDLSKIPNGKFLINTINAHSYNVARKDELFAEALAKGDYLIPDGMSVVKACKWLHAKSQPKERIAGADLFEYEMDRLNKKCGTVMFTTNSLTDGWQAVLIAGSVTGGCSLLTVLCYWAFGDSRRPYSKELHAVLEPTYTYYPLSAQGQLVAALEANDEAALEAVKRQSHELALVRYSDRDEHIFYSQLLRIEGRGYIPLTDIIINHKQPSK